LATYNAVHIELVEDPRRGAVVSEAIESWIESTLEPRYPELAAPCREADRICDAALESGHLSESSVSLLVESARSARTPLLPALDEAIAREAKPELRATLTWERDLLRDGFHIAESANGRVNITCRVSGGAVSTSFSKDEIETKGRQWIKERAVPGCG